MSNVIAIPNKMGDQARRAYPRHRCTTRRSPSLTPQSGLLESEMQPAAVVRRGGPSGTDHEVRQKCGRR